MQKTFLSYRFRLIPKQSHCALFSSYAGCRRYVWNRALELQDARFAGGDKWLNFAALCKELTTWRNDPSKAWLKESPCQVQQQAIRDLCESYKRFFNKIADKPKFKKKGRCRESFRFSKSDRFEIDQLNNRVKFPKVGWIRYRNSRPIVGKPRNITVSRRCGYWYMSVLVEQISPDPTHPHTESAIGIDVGVKQFAVTDVGDAIPPLNARQRIQRRLAGLQRVLARKMTFSGKWKRIRRKIANLRSKEVNRRHNYLHQLSHAISKSHAIVCVEALQVKNLTASAKGSVDKPGVQVAQKSGLNRVILDQGWSEFRRQLRYKLHRKGGRLVEVTPAYTSQACSRCGYSDRDNRPSRSVFCCQSCRHTEHADVNAAKNILAAGLAALMPSEGQPVTGTTPMIRKVRQSKGATRTIGSEVLNS